MSVSQKLLTFPHPCLGICSLTCSQGADPCTVLQQLVCKENQTAAGERLARAAAPENLVGKAAWGGSRGTRKALTCRRQRGSRWKQPGRSTEAKKHRAEGGQLGAEAPGSLGSTLQCEPRTASRIPARFSLSPHSCWCQNCLRGHSCLLPTLSWDWPTLMGPGSRK